MIENPPPPFRPTTTLWRVISTSQREANQGKAFIEIFKDLSPYSAIELTLPPLLVLNRNHGNDLGDELQVLQEKGGETIAETPQWKNPAQGQVFRIAEEVRGASGF